MLARQRHNYDFNIVAIDNDKITKTRIRTLKYGNKNINDIWERKEVTVFYPNDLSILGFIRIDKEMNHFEQRWNAVYCTENLQSGKLDFYENAIDTKGKEHIEYCLEALNTKDTLSFYYYSPATLTASMKDKVRKNFGNVSYPSKYTRPKTLPDGMILMGANPSPMFDRSTFSNGEVFRDPNHGLGVFIQTLLDRYMDVKNFGYAYHINTEALKRGKKGVIDHSRYGVASLFTNSNFQTSALVKHRLEALLTKDFYYSDSFAVDDAKLKSILNNDKILDKTFGMFLSFMSNDLNESHRWAKDGCFDLSVIYPVEKYLSTTQHIYMSKYGNIVYKNENLCLLPKNLQEKIQYALYENSILYLGFPSGIYMLQNLNLRRRDSRAVSKEIDTTNLKKNNYRNYSEDNNYHDYDTLVSISEEDLVPYTLFYDKLDIRPNHVNYEDKELSERAKYMVELKEYMPKSAVVAESAKTQWIGNKGYRFFLSPEGIHIVTRSRDIPKDNKTDYVDEDQILSYGIYYKENTNPFTPYAKFVSSSPICDDQAEIIGFTTLWKTPQSEIMSITIILDESKALCIHIAHSDKAITRDNGSKLVVLDTEKSTISIFNHDNFDTEKAKFNRKKDSDIKSNNLFADDSIRVENWDGVTKIAEIDIGKFIKNPISARIDDSGKYLYVYGEIPIQDEKVTGIVIYGGDNYKFNFHALAKDMGFNRPYAVSTKATFDFYQKSSYSYTETAGGVKVREASKDQENELWAALGLDPPNDSSTETDNSNDDNITVNSNGDDQIRFNNKNGWAIVSIDDMTNKNSKFSEKTVYIHSNSLFHEDCSMEEHIYIDGNKNRAYTLDLCNAAEDNLKYDYDVDTGAFFRHFGPQSIFGISITVYDIDIDNERAKLVQSESTQHTIPNYCDYTHNAGISFEKHLTKSTIRVSPSGRYMIVAWGVYGPPHGRDQGITERVMGKTSLFWVFDTVKLCFETFTYAHKSSPLEDIDFNPNEWNGGPDKPLSIEDCGEILNNLREVFFTSDDTVTVLHDKIDNSLVLNTDYTSRALCSSTFYLDRTRWRLHPLRIQNTLPYDNVGNFLNVPKISALNYFRNSTPEYNYMRNCVTLNGLRLAAYLDSSVLNLDKDRLDKNDVGKWKGKYTIVYNGRRYTGGIILEDTWCAFTGVDSENHRIFVVQGNTWQRYKYHETYEEEFYKTRYCHKDEVIHISRVPIDTDLNENHIFIANSKNVFYISKNYGNLHFDTEKILSGRRFLKEDKLPGVGYRQSVSTVEEIYENSEFFDLQMEFLWCTTEEFFYMRSGKCNLFRFYMYYDSDTYTSRLDYTFNNKSKLFPHKNYSFWIKDDVIYIYLPSESSIHRYTVEDFTFIDSDTVTSDSANIVVPQIEVNPNLSKDYVENKEKLAMDYKINTNVENVNQMSSFKERSLVIGETEIVDRREVEIYDRKNIGKLLTPETEKTARIKMSVKKET